VTAVGWPTVGAVLLKAAERHGDRTALVDGHTRLSYRALADRASRLGAGLRRLGLPPGARVAHLGENSHRLAEAYFGVPGAGLCLLPLNWRLAPRELAHVLADAGCSALIVDPGYEATAVQATAGTSVVLVPVSPRAVDGPPYESLLAAPPTGLREGIPSDLAYLYYTSGTTGRPKGVMLTHENVLAGALSSALAVGLAPDDVWLHAGPMFHLADAWAIWASCWTGGRQVVTRFEPEAVVRHVTDESVTRTLLVPTAVDMVVAATGQEQRLGGLRSLMFGGAPMPPTTYERAVDALDCPLWATFGMTETSGIATVLREPAEAPAHARWSSIGTETPLFDIALVPPSGQEPAAPERVGEMVVTSPAVMAGYWQRPEETAAVLDGRMLRTGDVARRDDGARLHIVDRIKDMIVSGGENVYALEVERVLVQHPRVKEVAVVAAPDDRWGEAVCAAVVAAGPIELEALRDFGRKQLAGYKLPRKLVLLERLPTTGSGKIDKAALRDLVRRPAAAG